MANNRFFVRSTESLEDNIERSAPAFFASYGLVGAILLLGAIGYLLDRWLGTTPWLLIAGLVAGVVIGLFGVISVARKG